MTSHRPWRSTEYGLAGVALAAVLMAAAPAGAASGAGVGAASGTSAGVGVASGQGSNGSGYNPSETDCVNVAQQPGRYAPDDLASCGIGAPMGGNGNYPGRG